MRRGRPLPLVAGGLCGRVVAVLFLTLCGCGRLGYDSQGLAAGDAGPGLDAGSGFDAGSPADAAMMGEDAGPPPPRGFSMVEAGQFHTCGIYRDAAYCWGDNSEGQLGDGTTTSSLRPVSVAGLPPGPVVWITAGATHSCAIVGLEAWCWGTGVSGELGDGSARNSPVPVRVVGFGTADASVISAGDRFTCALASGAVFCWGTNGSGQLGDGSTAARDVAEQVGPALPGGVTHVSSGQDHACALAGVQAWCWGHNDDGGALGWGMAGSSPDPVRVMVSSELSHVSIAGWHACAVASGGAAWCWGRNDVGELGDGTTVDRSTPVRVELLMSGVTALEAGGGPSPGDATCAIRAGRIHCWGNNQYGRLGVPGGAQSLPVPIPGVANAVSISVGYWHACAVLDDGSAVCWGRGEFGELGDGAGADSVMPVAVANPPIGA